MSALSKWKSHNVAVVSLFDTEYANMQSKSLPVTFTNVQLKAVFFAKVQLKAVKNCLDKTVSQKTTKSQNENLNTKSRNFPGEMSIVTMFTNWDIDTCKTGGKMLGTHNVFIMYIQIQISYFIAFN